MDILPTHDFMMLGIDDLENTGSLSYGTVLNVDIFHYMLSKGHILSYYHQSHQKILYWKIVTFTSFHNSDFCLQA